MAPNPVVITKLEFAIQPPNPSNPPFTIVLRARSGFGVSDGVSVRVGVALIVRVGVWLAVGIWVGRAVLVLVLVSVSVALGSGIAVLVAVFVGVWVFVWVGVSVNVALGTFVFVAVGRSVFVALGCAVLVAVNGAVADAVAGFLVAVSVRVRDFVGLLVGVRDFVRVLVAVLVRVATRPLFPAFPAACGTAVQCMQAPTIDKITIPVRRKDIFCIALLRSSSNHSRINDHSTIQTFEQTDRFVGIYADTDAAEIPCGTAHRPAWDPPVGPVD